MSALLFGSISTVADTSELQRQAFNQAFETHGLGWQWGQEEYVSLLESSGGQDRVAQYASKLGQDVDAAAVHATKSKTFQDLLGTADLSPRPGVVQSIRDAKEQGVKVGLVTTTSHANVAALLDALSPEVSSSDFDVIVDSSQVDQPKPNPAAYSVALETLGEQADECVAVEDNLGGLRAAQAAGVTCVAFPNQNTAGHDFGSAERVDHLDLTALKGLI